MKPKFEYIPQARAIWGLLLKSIQPPSDEVFYRWMLAGEVADYERAVASAARKYRNHAGDPVEVHKFVSAVLPIFRDKRAREQREQNQQKGRAA